jgi:hypothetical protein
MTIIAATANPLAQAVDGCDAPRDRPVLNDSLRDVLEALPSVARVEVVKYGNRCE